MMQLNEEITGTVRAKTRAVIEAKISGRVLAMNATLGQFVKAGDVLATLDAQEMQARAESAKAMLDQATSDERRTASLVATNAVSKSDYDAAKARLEVAKASVSEAQTMLGYAKVTAPFDGVITRKLADQGDLAAPGKPLLDLENPAQLRIEANIPETLIASLKIGASLDVTPKAKATVAEISPTGDPNSRTFPVKLDLPAGNTMRPGQFVRIAVPVREYEALVIPAAALVTRGQLQMVFVNDNNVAKLRLIRTGRERSEGIEVLAGLDGGESLVIEGAAKLMDGQPLSVTP
jgi:RND family efflux transporter MFP subunit